MITIKLNRFGVTGLLFMLGLAITAFVLMNIADVVSRIQKEEKGINKFAYSEKYWITPVDNEDFHLRAPALAPKVISATQNVNCNASFYELAVNIEHQIDYSFVELVMNHPDDPKLISRDKRPIDVNFQKDGNAIIIGESMIAVTENGDGRFLNFNGVIVPIAEILKNNSPSKIDNSIYAFWDCVDESLREYLTSRITERLSQLTLQIHFYDDDSIDDVRSFIGEMSELGLKCEPVGTYMGLGYEGTDAENLWYRVYNIIILPICIIFAVFTCFSASYLWLLSRTKEISIRKAYGYSNVKILSLIIIDEISFAVPSIITALIVQFVFCLFTDSLDFFDISFVLKFAFVCVGMPIITALCAARRIKHINEISPAAALKEI